MNKSKLLKILSFTIPLLVVGVTLMPGVVEAQNIIERVALSGINNVLAGFGSFFLGLSSYLVTISGTFLSVSINITTHLKDIYENVTAIQSVWRTIRDISSIFIIFSLLYFSIKTILGIGTSGFNSLIVKIFLAGILINFSLFFFKLAIDASNIISLQFYRAIAPNTEQNWTVKQSFTDGGLSNVFMQSLKIPTIYQNNGILKSADVSLAIAFATYAGIIMMVVASLSFLAAAIAFTARTAILLFCLAMSPIYFVGLIFPEIKSKVSDKIMGLLYGQVVFMPVYLFLLYIALRIISDPSFNKIFNANVAGASDPGGIGAISIGVIIQYTIAIFFINLPLVAAIDLGGKGMKWAPDAGKVGRFMTGGFGKNIAGAAGRNTFGRLGKLAGEGFDNMAAASQNNKYGRAATSVLRTLGISQAVRGGLASTEGGRYGGRQSLADVKKEDKDRIRVVSGVQRGKAQLLTINSTLNSADHRIPKEFATTIASMDVKEFEELGEKDFEKLKDPKLITAIPSSKFESLLKSDKFSIEEQGALRKAREDGYTKILTETDATYLIKTLLKGKPGDIAKLPGDILKRTDVSVQLDPAALRKMVDENVSEDIRRQVRENIEDAATSPGIAPPMRGSALDKSSRYLQDNFVF